MLPHALWKCKESKFLEDHAETQPEASVQRTSGLCKSSWNRRCCWASSQAGLLNRRGRCSSRVHRHLVCQGQPKERWLLFWDEEGKGLPPGSGTQEQSLKAPQSRKPVLAYSSPGSPHDPTQKNKRQQDNDSVPALHTHTAGTISLCSVSALHTHTAGTSLCSLQAH